MMKLTEDWIQAAIGEVPGDIEVVDLEEAGSRERRIFRVFVDTPQGVDHETCARVSEVLGRALDGAGYGEGAYTLEVSSPGLDRPLRKPQHFETYAGNEVYVKTVEPVEGRKVWRGELQGVQGDSVVLNLNGNKIRIQLANIAKAHLVFNF